MKQIIVAEEKANRLMQQTVNRLLSEKPLSDDKILGPDVLAFCQHKQINNFVVFQIYQDWNSHMHRIAHPYFDFENEEVRSALNNFLNKLSQHIAINEHDYRKLLENAVFNTIKFILNPKDLLSKFFFAKTTALPIATFNKHAGYFSDFGFVIKSIRDFYAKNEATEVEKEDFFTKFDRVIELYEKREGKEFKEYQAQLFKKAFGVEIEDLIKAPVEKPRSSPKAVKVENPSTRKVTPPPIAKAPVVQPTPEIIPPVIEVEPAKEEPVIVPKVEVQPPVLEPEEVETVKEIVDETPVKEPVVEQTKIDKPVPEEKPNADLEPSVQDEPIDLFGGGDDSQVPVNEEEPRTVADRFRKNTDSKNLGDSYEKEESKSVDIPVHKQFQFVQKIFSGSSVKYKVVLEKIGEASNAGAAQEILDKYVLNAPDVNSESEVVQEFVELIRGRF